MQIQIESPDFPTTPALAAHVRRRLSRGLDSAAAPIRSVRVHLSDINGHRRGIDKRCRLVVRLDHLPEVVAVCTSDDLYLAITRAAARAANAVVRRTTRRQSSQRQHDRLASLRTAGGETAEA